MKDKQIIETVCEALRQHCYCYNCNKMNKPKLYILPIILSIILLSIPTVVYINARDAEFRQICSLDSVYCQDEYKVPPEATSAPNNAIFGVASYYDYVLDSGWSSAGHYVCATRDFDRYEMVKVTDLDTGKSVTCKITDFGPDAKIHPDRVIDLSSTAFAELKPLKYGVINNVKVERL